MFIDTHCHISTEDYDNIDLIIKENKENNVDKMIISGYSRNTIKESLKLIDKYDCLYATIGYHPSEADITTEDDLNNLEKMIQNKKIVGIGEIGLDYHYGNENKNKQIELFIKQMKLAEKYNLPVVIHSRDATQDTIEVLKKFPNLVGDMHCFSGSIETAKIYISMGYKLGIGGVVTFKNSNLYQVVQAVGIDNILLETDAPYLTPEPFRGKINSSKYISYIAKRIAQILNIDEEKVGKITTDNAYTLFDLK
ncbi:MAG: TatD family hydrolase [Bacilli bacterium]|nr:TatD family hydrolase [Bacilli bacterium]